EPVIGGVHLKYFNGFGPMSPPPCFSLLGRALGDLIAVCLDDKVDELPAPRRKRRGSFPNIGVGSPTPGSPDREVAELALDCAGNDTGDNALYVSGCYIKDEDVLRVDFTSVVRLGKLLLVEDSHPAIVLRKGVGDIIRQASAKGKVDGKARIDPRLSVLDRLRIARGISYGTQAEDIRKVLKSPPHLFDSGQLGGIGISCKDVEAIHILWISRKAVENTCKIAARGPPLDEVEILRESEARKPIRENCRQELIMKRI